MTSEFIVYAPLATPIECCCGGSASGGDDVLKSTTASRFFNGVVDDDGRLATADDDDDDANDLDVVGNVYVIGLYGRSVTLLLLLLL
mmetsp:Transcript_14656/g.21112  ORF Transcript_14656/g.21112 Transcript_14656/m.21112 type:complete len:87 (-) Transcript_14656:13-273(-)